MHQNPFTAYNHYLRDDNKLQRYRADIPSLSATNSHLELTLITNTLFMRTNSFGYKLCLTCKNFNLYETGCFAKNNAHPWPNLLQ